MSSAIPCFKLPPNLLRTHSASHVYEPYQLSQRTCCYNKKKNTKLQYLPVHASFKCLHRLIFSLAAYRIAPEFVSPRYRAHLTRSSRYKTHRKNPTTREIVPAVIIDRHTSMAPGATHSGHCVCVCLFAGVFVCDVRLFWVFFLFDPPILLLFSVAFQRHTQTTLQHPNRAPTLCM